MGISSVGVGIHDQKGVRGCLQLYETGDDDRVRTIYDQVDPGKPDQFCNPLGGFALFGFGGMVSVTTFPAAWRVELVDDVEHRGFGYVR